MKKYEKYILKHLKNIVFRKIYMNSTIMLYCAVRDNDISSSISNTLLDSITIVKHKNIRHINPNILYKLFPKTKPIYNLLTDNIESIIISLRYVDNKLIDESRIIYKDNDFKNVDWRTANILINKLRGKRWRYINIY